MQEIIVITNQLSGFMTNCYTVYNQATRQAIIIDPASNASFISEMIKNQKLKCVGIFLTHGHEDHMGALPELVEKLGGDVKVYAAKEEAEVLGNPGMNLSMMISGVPKTLTPDVLLEDGEVISILGTTVQCKLLPGHTQGGMCYYFEENNMVFSGDTLFAGSIGRSDFPTGNGIALVKGIRQQLLVLPEDTIVYPGHNERTTIKREKSSNPFLIV